MNWSFLLLLACPLMMVFCMGSLFRFGKKKPSHADSISVPAMGDDLKAMQLHMADLMMENHRLKESLQQRQTLQEMQANSSPTSADEQIRLA